MSVYADALKQMSTAVTWLIGALAAVAAAMIAGSQLSSIGQLDRVTDRDRLGMAVISVAVAVGLIVFSIGLLYRAQSPTTTDFSRLMKLARAQKTRGLDAQLCSQVRDDSTLHRGELDLKGLSAELARIRSRFYELKTQEYNSHLAWAGEADATRRAVLVAEHQRCKEQLEVVDDRLTEYRTAMLRVAQLDKFLRTRRRYRNASWTVLALSVLAASGFVVFAWAANPPAKPDAVVPQRLVAAHLSLTADGRKSLEQQLGKDCAAAAAGKGGIPVIAMSSSDSGVEVVLVPSDRCPEPKRLVILPESGEVIDDRPVLPLPGTASPS